MDNKPTKGRFSNSSEVRGHRANQVIGEKVHRFFKHHQKDGTVMTLYQIKGRLMIYLSTLFVFAVKSEHEKYGEIANLLKLLQCYCRSHIFTHKILRPKPPYPSIWKGICNARTVQNSFLGPTLYAGGERFFFTRVRSVAQKFIFQCR